MKLLEQRKNDPELLVRLAQMALWGKHFDEALRRYHDLLAKDWQQPDLCAGYGDAAASAYIENNKAKELPEDSKSLLLKIYDRTSDSKDPVYLTRLAWVMRRLKEPAKAVAMLQKALVLDPGKREVKRHLAEALRVLAHGDPSVALVASMHPAVLQPYVDVRAEAAPGWLEQRRWIFETARDGGQWGTIVSAPGSGGVNSAVRLLARGSIRDQRGPG